MIICLLFRGTIVKVPPDKEGRILEIIARDWFVNVVDKEWTNSRYKIIRENDFDVLSLIPDQREIYLAEIKRSFPLNKKELKQILRKIKNKCNILKRQYEGYSLRTVVLITFSEINDEAKKELRKTWDIVVWDIRDFKEKCEKSGKSGGKWYLEALKALGKI